MVNEISPESVIQKDSIAAEQRPSGNFSDLSVTPADIEKSMEAFNTIKYDGTAVERTFVDYQATDSFGNVYIRNTTSEKDINIEKILNQRCIFPVDDYSEPTVLIFHTHSTESYMMADNGKISSDYLTRSDNKSINMIRIGEEISGVLESKGIGTIHDTTIYDTSYTGAYAASRMGISKILEENPSVVIVLDIHRDAIHYDKYTFSKPITEINGSKAAQMMIITGAEGGGVTDFPDWKTNLSFAVNLQNAVNNRYPELMKPILFSHRKYNMDITPYSLLIEVGTDANTLAEAAYSGRLLGDVLADFIKENCEDE